MSGPSEPDPRRSASAPGELWTASTTVDADALTTDVPATAATETAADSTPADRTPANGGTPAPETAAPDEPSSFAGEPVPRQPSFRERARVRRRARFLRRLREVQLRDLGGFVFELHRFGRERSELVAGKLAGLKATDDELRGLEALLGLPPDDEEIREPGIGGACPRCHRLHGSTDSFCPGCGLDLAAARRSGSTAGESSEAR